MAELSARVGQALLDMGCAPDRPIAMLCDATVNFAILKLAAMQIGVPIVPISSAYALMSRDFAKLKFVLGTIRPAMIYVADAVPYMAALKAVDLAGAEIVCD